MTLTFHPDPREPKERTSARGVTRLNPLTWRGLAGLVLLGAFVAGPMVFVAHASWTTAVLVGGGVVGAVLAAGRAAQGRERRKAVPLCRVCGRAVEDVEPLRADAPVKRCPECGGAME